MCKKLKILIQYLVPQHLLSRLVGFFAESRIIWLKNFLIKAFMHFYSVDLKSARLEKISDYPDFNSFFTRQLKPELRPIVTGAKELACPVDGVVSQAGKINRDVLFQAKGLYYSLSELLGNSENHVKTFYEGSFATFYLAPKDYHRIHMPYAGELRETIYIPGNLFSVNPLTTAHVPRLFSRNERLVCFFETNAGPMAVILVGAMIVGSIKTAWPLEYHGKRTLKKFYENMIRLDKGTEMGLFKLGSTVIVLFPKDSMSWSENISESKEVRMGELMGELSL
jgi:phosphatidylserine decarboxylase